MPTWFLVQGSQEAFLGSHTKRESMIQGEDEWCSRFILYFIGMFAGMKTIDILDKVKLWGFEF
jgi:hypothetical protein